MKRLFHPSYPFVRPFTGVMTSIKKTIVEGPTLSPKSSFPHHFFPPTNTVFKWFLRIRMQGVRENLYSVGAGFTLSSPDFTFSEAHLPSTGYRWLMLPHRLMRISTSWRRRMDFSVAPNPEKNPKKRSKATIWKLQFRNQILGCILSLEMEWTMTMKTQRTVKKNRFGGKGWEFYVPETKQSSIGIAS